MQLRSATTLPTSPRAAGVIVLTAGPSPDQIVRRVRIRAAESTAEHKAQIERLELAGCVDQAAALK